MLLDVKRRHEIRSNLSGGWSLDRVLELALSAAGWAFLCCMHLPSTFLLSSRLLFPSALRHPVARHSSGCWLFVDSR